MYAMQCCKLVEYNNYFSYNSKCKNNTGNINSRFLILLDESDCPIFLDTYFLFELISMINVLV
jgi:hypothetical protein